MEHFYEIFMRLVIQWQWHRPAGDVMFYVFIAILVVGVPFFLVCIFGFLGDLKRHKHE